jgi:hypothetical protein
MRRFALSCPDVGITEYEELSKTETDVRFRSRLTATSEEWEEDEVTREIFDLWWLHQVVSPHANADMTWARLREIRKIGLRNGVALAPKIPKPEDCEDIELWVTIRKLQKAIKKLNEIDALISLNAWRRRWRITNTKHNLYWDTQ